jgi:hypothetical protein
MLTTVLLIVIYNIKLEQNDVTAATADPAAAESNKEFFVFVSEPGAKLQQNFLYSQFKNTTLLIKDRSKLCFSLDIG